MPRPTYVQIDPSALLHNVNQVKRSAPGCKIIAMVKANAYGCAIASIAPFLENQIDAFGVACLEEALAIRALGLRTDCVLFQGPFSDDEFKIAAANKFQCVIHQPYQLHWLLAHPLSNKLKIWVKVNTGMHRLGFSPHEIYDVLTALANCSWVDNEIGLMTHLASADEPENPSNKHQLDLFNSLNVSNFNLIKSISNSAAIISLPAAHCDVVRPGIMLYGVSPFAEQTGQGLGLKPVMRFISAISAIHHYPANAKVGYGGVWQTTRPSTIAVVAAGYGDGYPRHLSNHAAVWINGTQAPIVGRVSMDSLTIDVTDGPAISIGDPVELWGLHIPVEQVASSAGTIAYELLCQISPRVSSLNRV